jgi:peptide/nickel transport system ATP-binding protein
MPDEKLLHIENLVLHFRTTQGVVQAVDGVDFDLHYKEAVVVLGESGCGKTSLAKAILRLLPRNVETYSGKVYLEGTDVMSLDDEEFRQQVRWVKMSMVPQAAMNALNPVLRVGDQVAEPIIVHGRARREDALAQAESMFQQVGVPGDFAKRYAFELSGGMRQRVMIAMALSCNPKLLIADEPTTALDVTIQAQIMQLLRELQREYSMSVVLITHDIGLVAQMADRVLVMYAGQVVEQAEVHDLFRHPSHPYTQMLLSTVPSTKDPEDRVLESIPGVVPETYYTIRGCRFADRCPYAKAECSQPQSFYSVSETHMSRCRLCGCKQEERKGGESCA